MERESRDANLVCVRFRFICGGVEGWLVGGGTTLGLDGTASLFFPHGGWGGGDGPGGRSGSSAVRFCCYYSSLFLRGLSCPAAGRQAADGHVCGSYAMARQNTTYGVVRSR